MLSFCTIDCGFHGMADVYLNSIHTSHRFYSCLFQINSLHFTGIKIFGLKQRQQNAVIVNGNYY